MTGEHDEWTEVCGTLPPAMEHEQAGSRWQCTGCGKRFKLTHPTKHSPYGEWVIDWWAELREFFNLWARF